MTKRIAIVRRNGLGDLLCVMPLVYLCKERYPGCHITLFVDQRAQPLTPFLEGVDRVVVIPVFSNKYGALLKTIWAERHHCFDLIISAKSSPMKLLNLFLYALRGRRRVAYVSKAWHSRLINEPRLHDPQEQRHQMVKTVRLLDPTLEAVPLHLKPRLKVTPTFSFKHKTLLISVTNNRKGSRLDDHKIQRLLNQQAQKGSFQVVINCEPSDTVQAYRVAEGLDMPTQVMPTASFPDFLSLIASVDALFIGDGGIMHLAAALDKPQVVLFGGTKIWEWAPLSELAICLADPHNVNFIPEEKIEKALEHLL